MGFFIYCHRCDVAGEHILKNSILPSIYPVACHTDNVGPGTTFVAIQGMKQNGVDHIPVALAKGASRVVVALDAVVPEEMMQQIRVRGIDLARVESTRSALAELSAQALGHPAQKLKIIAITGTKGKTTTTFLLAHLLRSLGKKTAMLSTVHNRIGDEILTTKLTTQQPDYLHVFFDVCVNQGIEYVVMETAAQAFTLHRVAGIRFDAAIFTNFSKEHGEFYTTEEEYFAAKLQIVEHLKPGAPLFLNADDERLRELGVRCLSGVCWFSPTLLDTSSYFCPALIGAFNQYNVAAATSCVEVVTLSTRIDIQHALHSFSGVPGRLEKYDLPNGALGIIDYAHNPSSFEAVLGELRTLTPHLIAVFGCGGERDVTKRPLMGAIASAVADLVVVTADNPRSEQLSVINAQILSGIALEHKNRVVVEESRERAIRLAYERSQSGSIIVLLGKGPDEYQIVQGMTYPFSEKRILKSL